MEVIMSSPVQECSGMENDRGDGAAKLSKSQKKRKRKLLKKKLHASLESFDKREDTENPESKLEVPCRNVDIITQSSIQDNPNTGLGTTATVDQKRTVSSTAATGDEKSSISKKEGYREIAKGEKRSSRTTAVDVKTGSKREEYMEIGNDMRGSSRNATLDVKTLSKREEQTGIADGEMGCSTAIGTRDANSTVSKREHHMKIANGETVSSGTAIIDANTGSKREEYMETASGETVSGKIGTPDAKTVSKGEEHTKVANGQMGSSTTTNLNVEGTVQKKKKQRSRRKRPTFGENLNPRDMETAIGETGSGTTATDNTVSKKRKRQKLKNKNPASGDILSNRENTQDMVIAKKGSSTTKVLEAMSGETVSGKIATPDAKIVSKGEEHTKVANGEMGSSTTTNLNVNGTVKKKKKQKSRKRKPTLGEILNPRYLQDMETANGETGSGTTATDNTASKKRRRQKLKNKKPASGDILSTGESTQDTVIAKKGSGTNKVLEAMSTESKREDCPKIVNGEKCPRTTALDAESTMLKSVGCTEVANSEMGSSRTTTIDENTGSSGIATLDVMKTLSKREEHTIIANGEMGLRTTSTCDAKSVVLEREWQTKIVGGETASTRIAIVDAKTGLRGEEYMEISESKREEYTKVANGETGSKIIATRDAKSTMSESNPYMRSANGGTDSSRTTTIDAKTVSKVEECTKVGNVETGSNTTTTLIAKSTEPENIKRQKRKKPTIGDILNPRYLENLEIAEEIADANRALIRKIKRQRVKKNRALRLNTHKNTEVKVIDEITHVATSGKKLLIFDVNGLLADIVSPKPKDFKADKYIPKRAIFKRPFLDDFLCFCFERFNVGIWSSRTKKILDPVVNYLLGDLKKKLLFLWDASSCTNSGMRTLEEKHKCIVFKDLRKIWEKNGPGDSWVKGTFNESNTLLLDDSPYKALLNPKHTGIFPVSYSYKNTNDDFLGPKGDLRTYLEGVAATDNVKMYVEQHPFGQGAIDETSPHWAFYSRVLKGQK